MSREQKLEAAELVARLRAQHSDLQQGAYYGPNEDPKWDATLAAAEFIAALGEQEATPPEPPECASGCGCRWLDDPDRRDCACDGPCCMDEGWATLPDGSPRPDESWDDDEPAAPQVAPEPERCPTCRSDVRWKRGWMVFDTPCWDPWHRPAPLVEGEQTDA